MLVRARFGRFLGVVLRETRPFNDTELASQ